MEWVLLLVLALAATSLVALPLHGGDEAGEDGGRLDDERLSEQRALLLAELREFDDDLAAGRISDEDRREGRAALAPRLRDVTERLREAGGGREGGRE
jgi:predicted aminopeptidase